ncbi:cytochrome P450 [Roridomyces roridus]|uniref:Cytochrome P450 n=1 Tax=Roridomyces roridus TaxID=1738132 RepID=A0AAD7CMH7_9AGAR|nr:cytochrome P450 [Roridomyces roridus]
MNSSSATLLCSLLLAASTALFLRRRARKLPPLPPGPKKLPLVGNLFSLPSHSEWETYAKWSKECNSDIIHLDAAGQSIVVLCSLEAAEDLLDKRSGIYSDRARLNMFNDLVIKDDFMFAFEKYGDTWRTHRRLFYREFSPTAVDRYHDQELKEALKLLELLLDTPHEFVDHFHHVMGSLLMSIIYGIDVQRSNDPYLHTAEMAARAMSEAAVPGRYLVDLISPLKYIPDWFPGAGFKRQAAEGNRLVKEMRDVPFMHTRQAAMQGTARPCFVTEYMREGKIESVEEEIAIKQVARTAYAAGTDTITATLIAFLRTMVEHPEVQKKAQRELDSVVAAGQLPSLADEKALPYVTAVIKETMRRWPVGPIGIPHFVATDDIYRSYRIPGGSIVIANLWAMLHDESDYPDPQLFNPERFLHGGQLNPSIRDPLSIVFGFRRRVCPGRHMAWDTVWITMASILATFDISKALDADGRPIEPEQGYTSQLVCVPVPFECSIKPRSKDVEELIRSMSMS